MTAAARFQGWVAPLAAAALVVVVLGPGARGWAAAALALAGTAGARLLLPGVRAQTRTEPVLRVVARVSVGGRSQLVLVETGGRRYLVSQGASVTPLPLEERP